MARYGAGGTRGRRITGDDMPLYAYPEEIGKGLLPTMGQLRHAGQTVNVNARVAAGVAKPKLQQGWKAATATPTRSLATGGVLGATTMAAAPNRNRQPQTINYFGKAREYDYDRNRNRRLGAAEASLLLGGGYAGYRGVQGTREETERMRNAKIRTGVGSPDKNVGQIWGRRALAISRRNALLMGGGAASIAAAGAVHAHGNSNKGRVYR